MKIGLLTHHWPSNFGANLQAFSTVRALERMGHSVHVLNYRPPKMAARYETIVGPLQSEQHESFICEYMQETRICSNQDELIAVARELSLECVVCGSDAVLRLQPDSDREDLTFPNPFWLGWVDEGVRVGFLAASCMGSQYFMFPKPTRRSIAEAAKALNYCTVRDSWSRWMLRLCGVPSTQVHHCPDPVCGIHAALEGIDTSRPDGGDVPYILMSLYPRMLPEGWVEEFVEEANRRGFQVYGLPQPDVEAQGSFSRILPLPMSPLDWYRWIANASGYVGIRFHPIMLSQINAVPYVALDDYDVGLQFKPRYLRALARLMLPFTRRCSKTYDASERVAKEKYCIPRRWYSRTTPNEVLDLLDEQRGCSAVDDFNSAREQQYFDSLKQIVGKGDS
jgi:hypothetical protein